MSQITLLVSQITLLVSQITLLKPVSMDTVCDESADTVNYVMNIVISDQPYHPIVFLGYPGLSWVFLGYRSRNLVLVYCFSCFSSGHTLFALFVQCTFIVVVNVTCCNCCVMPHLYPVWPVTLLRVFYYDS